MNKEVVNKILGMDVEKLKGELTNQLPFMVDREKADVTMGQVLTISDYGYLNGQDGEFVCFIVKEDDSKFYFGGSVLTDQIKKIEDKVPEDKISQGLNEGIFTVKFEKQKAKKSGRTYTAVEFFV